MVNKKPGESRVYQVIEKLIRAGLPNAAVLDEIKRQFPNGRTTPEQVRFSRQTLRSRDKSVPSGVEARRRFKLGTKDSSK